MCGQRKGEHEPHCWPKNLKFINASKEAAPRDLISLVKKLKEQSADPIREIQVAVAVNKRSPLCREKLNGELQNILNPNGKICSGSPFREGDKVIQLKNGFLRLVESRLDGEGNAIFSPIGGEDSQVAVANGEFGTVLKVEPTKTIVRFDNLMRTVMVTRAAGKKEKEDRHDVKERPAEGKEDEEKTSTGCDLDLGYACTVWKLQGSSAPKVILAIDEWPGALGQYGNCDRSYVFTGISRAEVECYIVGKKAIAEMLCKRQFIHRRKTFMSELLGKYIAEKKAELALTLERKHDGRVNSKNTTGEISFSLSMPTLD